MAKKINWLITAKQLLAQYRDKKLIVKKTDPLYKRILGLLVAGKEESALDLLLPDRRVMKYSDNNFTVDDKGNLFLTGETTPVHKLIAEKLLSFSQRGLDYKALINFWKNLEENPVESSREDLYAFLTANDHPITQDGYFIAYKAVRRRKDGKLVDIATGNFINNVGQQVWMKRKDVDPDRENTCSRGLHVTAFKYADEFYGGTNDVLVMVLIDPRDVVAVPPDYNQQKMRVCEYTVVGIQNREIKKLYLSNDVILNNMKAGLKKNGGFDPSDMTSSQIIKFVTALTGEEIKASLKSKKTVVKKANEILAQHDLLPEQKRVA